MVRRETSSRRVGLRPTAQLLAILMFATCAHARTAGPSGESPCANFAQVSAGFYRGAEPEAQCLEHLAALGIRTIVNLRNEQDASDREQKDATARGMRYFNVPLSGFGKPEPAEVQKILSIIRTPGNQPVFLHCKRGADRTGAIVAVYRIQDEGWTTERALEEAKSFGLAWWQIRMKDFIRDDAGGSASAVDAIGAWSGEVQVHGTLRAMMHEGKTGAVVTLDAMLPNPRMYAVGALADLAGEITMIGGTVYLSYPVGAQETRTETLAASDAGAALLVAAEVSQWLAVTIKDPIRFEDLDDTIEELAAAAGTSLDGRFPFLLEGDFEDLQWHVIDGSRLATGGTSHQDHLAASIKTRRQRASARLIGFYSQNDQGVFTHMGSRTHLHCVLDEPLATGHVDHVIIPVGTIIKLPAGVRAAPGEAKQDGALTTR